ncbi:hypothetical protein HDU91_003264 [Kappamyces sp. JEL0680]|nr:hypothetical protein HDU91_003264 [Kappamyces sp. JEL0680]
MTQPDISVHTSQESLCLPGQELNFALLFYKMKESVFVWVGESGLGLQDAGDDSNQGRSPMSSLVLSMLSKQNESLAMATTLLPAKQLDDIGDRMSKRLALKFKCPFFLSYSLSTACSPEMLMAVEKRIFDRTVSSKCRGFEPAFVHHYKPTPSHKACIRGPEGLAVSQVRIPSHAVLGFQGYAPCSPSREDLPAMGYSPFFKPPSPEEKKMIQNRINTENACREEMLADSHALAMRRS